MGSDYTPIIPRRPNYEPEQAGEILAVSADGDDRVAVLIRLGLGGERVGQADYRERDLMPTGSEERPDQRGGGPLSVVADQDRLSSRVAFPQGGH